MLGCVCLGLRDGVEGLGGLDGDWELGFLNFDFVVIYLNLPTTKLKRGNL